MLNNRPDLCDNKHKYENSVNVLHLIISQLRQQQRWFSWLQHLRLTTGKKSSKMVNLLPVCKHQYSSFVTLARFCLLYPLLESDNKSHHYVKFYKVCSYNATFILKRITKMNLPDIKWTKSLAPISEAHYIYYRGLRQKKTTYPLALYLEIKAPYTILFFYFYLLWNFTD